MTTTTTDTTQSYRYPARARDAYHADEGDVFQTLLGEKIRVRRDNGDDTIELDYMDRPTATGSETVHRDIFAARAGFEGYECIAHGQVDGVMRGQFTTTPRCPECKRYMETFYDGEGWPAAGCTRADCDGIIDVDDLLDGGYFEEWA